MMTFHIIPIYYGQIKNDQTTNQILFRNTGPSIGTVVSAEHWSHWPAGRNRKPHANPWFFVIFSPQKKQMEFHLLFLEKPTHHFGIYWHILVVYPVECRIIRIL